MDDLDRTFERLKRPDYNTLVSRIKAGPIVDPYTFDMRYSRWCEPQCIANGWTLKELNEELEKRQHDNQ